MSRWLVLHRSPSDGQTVGEGDFRGQIRRCLEISADALAAVGATLRDVVRTRVMLTGRTRWREAAAVHAKYLSHIMLPATFIEVSGASTTGVDGDGTGRLVSDDSDLDTSGFARPSVKVGLPLNK
jgi:enamine deaminase RidA (YjgF/YER057c/UK114 family)